jgi:hypothetical protein
MLYQLTAMYIAAICTLVCACINSRYDHSVCLTDRITTTEDKHVDKETRYGKMTQCRVPDKEDTSGTTRTVLEEYSNNLSNTKSRVRIDLTTLNLSRDACTTGCGQVSNYIHIYLYNVIVFMYMYIHLLTCP